MDIIQDLLDLGAAMPNAYLYVTLSEVCEKDNQIVVFPIRSQGSERIKAIIMSTPETIQAGTEAYRSWFFAVYQKEALTCVSSNSFNV